MGEFTTFNDNNAVNYKPQPKSSTIELLRQYARVYTPLSAIAFSQLIAN